MQKSFEILSSTGAYTVAIGSGAIAHARRLAPGAIFLCDRNIESYLPADIDPIFIDATEKAKSLEAMPGVIRALRARKADRGSHLVAIGGGITQDIATFAASVYMRGIPWTYLPTTLLGMVDSCIGGKSSINVEEMKNLVGNFYPPGHVLVDPAFLPTLDAQDIVGGLCEAVKICFARGSVDFSSLIDAGAVPPLSPETATRIITQSLLVKKWFIEIDEFDQKERLLLNFGHTFGHALESATSYEIKHGVGVGIGMLVAIEFQKHLGRMSAEGSLLCDRLSDYVHKILGQVAGLAAAAKVDSATLLGHFENDKKHRAGEYRLILPVESGALAIVSVAKTPAMQQAIVQSYETVLAGLGS